MTPEIWNQFRASIKSVVVEAVREAISATSLDRRSLPKMATDQEPFLMSPPETAKRMRISARTLWKLTAAGEVPSMRLGRLVRYSPRAIQDWIEHHEVKSRQRPRDQPHQSKAIRNAKGQAGVPINDTVEAEMDRPRYISDICAERLGVSPDDLPTLTNGELAKIAQVDSRVLHSWTYHRCEIPEEAIARVQEYFFNWLQTDRVENSRAARRKQ